MEQTYTNSFDTSIEAVYVFPMPALAAVNDFVMEIGARKIVGVVRPRDAQQVAHASTTTNPPGAGVPNAGGINPPVLRPGQRSGHDIGLTVTLDAGLPITSLAAVTHRVTEQRPGADRRVITLASDDSIPWTSRGA